MSMVPGFTVRRECWYLLGIPNYIKTKCKLLILSYLYEYQFKNASHYQLPIKQEAIMKSCICL